MKEETGEKRDVVKLTRHLLNRAASNRTISKQECMVLLSQLDLVTCTETIETVSISGSYNLKKNPNYAANAILSQYSRRDKDDPEVANLTLHQYFRHKKGKSNFRKEIIPHYVGGQSQPKYPPTEGYARSILVIHKPWHGTDGKDQAPDSYIPEFLKFLEQPDCPKEVSIPYQRVKARHQDKKEHVEPVSEEITIRDVPADDPDTQILLAIAATLRADVNPDDPLNMHSFDRGLNFDWGKRRFPVSATLSTRPATVTRTATCVPFEADSISSIHLTCTSTKFSA